MIANVVRRSGLELANDVQFIGFSNMKLGGYDVFALESANSLGAAKYEYSALNIPDLPDLLPCLSKLHSR